MRFMALTVFTVMLKIGDNALLSRLYHCDGLMTRRCFIGTFTYMIISIFSRSAVKLFARHIYKVDGGIE